MPTRACGRAHELGQRLERATHSMFMHTNFRQGRPGLNKPASCAVPCCPSLAVGCLADRPPAVPLVGSVSLFVVPPLVPGIIPPVLSSCGRLGPTSTSTPSLVVRPRRTPQYTHSRAPRPPSRPLSLGYPPPRTNGQAQRNEVPFSQPHTQGPTHSPLQGPRRRLVVTSGPALCPLPPRPLTLLG